MPWHPRLSTLALVAALAAVPSFVTGGGDAPAADPCETHADAPTPDPAGGFVVVETLCASGDSHVASASASEACASRAYARLSYHWATPYHVKVDARGSRLDGWRVRDAFNAAGETWDAATSKDVFGRATLGGEGWRAGTKDGVSQVGFRWLGSSGVIAKTTTWYDGKGRATESDGQYNTYYYWSTMGAAGKMDVRNLATHEMGHTFGLTHPATTAANACLTMYAKAMLGETARRSLGDGDALGLRAIYGP